MNLEKTVKELSQNEKKVLLTLNELKGKGSPQELLEKGGFSQEVEVMNASSWLLSKKLVKKVVDTTRKKYDVLAVTGAICKQEEKVVNYIRNNYPIDHLNEAFCREPGLSLIWLGKINNIEEAIQEDKTPEQIAEECYLEQTKVENYMQVRAI